MARVILIGFIFLSWFKLGMAFAEPQPGKRYALVVGNSAYENVEPLANPAKDASAISEALEALDFDVFKGIDLDLQAFERLISEFTAASADGDVILFYYAGHGFQLAGLNHLLPIDAVLRDRSSIGSQSLVLDDIIARIHRKGGQTIVLLDACRNNPLPGPAERAPQGLAELQTGDGVFIAFATQPGKTAWDGRGANSPFTRALLTHIGKPGQSLSDMMIRVRNDVKQATFDTQTPWDQSSLLTQFYFAPATRSIEAELPARSGIILGPAPKAAPPATTLAEPPNSSPAGEVLLEVTYWNSIKDSGNRALLQSYLEQYPDGEFGNLARLMIDQIDRQETARVQPVAIPRTKPGDEPSSQPKPGRSAAKPPAAKAPVAQAPGPRSNLRARGRHSYLGDRCRNGDIDACVVVCQRGGQRACDKAKRHGRL